MARRRNRWRLECRAAARSVRAAHGQRVRLIVKLDEHAELRAHGERNGRAREFFDLVPVRGQCRCDAAVNVFVPRRHIARAASRSARRRAARASARFCWRFLCRPNPASAEFLDDVIKLGLDRFLVEVVLAKIGICLAHGGDQAPTVGSHAVGPDTDLETGARTAGADGIRRWRALQHQSGARCCSRTIMADRKLVKRAMIEAPTSSARPLRSTRLRD